MVTIAVTLGSKTIAANQCTGQRLTPWGSRTTAATICNVHGGLSTTVVTNCSVRRVVLPPAATNVMDRVRVYGGYLMPYRCIAATTREISGRIELVSREGSQITIRRLPKVCI